MVKMKSKNTLPPTSGSENTNLIVVLPNSDPIYHFLTAPGRRRARQKLGNIGPPGGIIRHHAIGRPQNRGGRYFDFKIGPHLPHFMSRQGFTFPNHPQPPDCASPKIAQLRPLGALGGTYVGQKNLGLRLLTKKWGPKTHHNLPKSPTCTLNTPWK